MSMPQSAEPRAKRDVRSTLIEPFKQIKFGLYVIAMSLAFVFLTSGMFLYAFSEQYKHVMSIFNITDMAAQMELITNDIFYRNARLIGGFFAIFLAFELWVIFRLTHRYYGPLVSIERFVDQITQGDFTKRVLIRKKDELHRLVEKLNTMADALENKKR